DSVSPPPLVAKPKKGKYQTVALTLPESQGPKASGALSKKRTKPKSKRPPTKTKESPPKPTKGSEDITFTTPDEGTTKTTPRLEGSLGDKDSGETNHPLIWNYYTPLMLISQGLVLRDLDTQPILLTYADVRAILLSEDEAQESDEEVIATGDDMDEDPHDDKEVRTPLPKQEQSKPSHVQEFASDSSSPDLKRFDNILPLTERQLIRDQSDKLVEAFMSSLDRSSTTISDLYKGLNVITQLLKEISNTVKDDPATNQKSIKSMMTEMYAAFQGRPSPALSGSITPTLALTDIQANVKGENATTTVTKEPLSHTEEEIEEPRLAITISSIPSTVILPTQPITSIIIHLENSQATPKIDKGKGISIEYDDDPLKKLVKASSIVRPDPDEPIIVEFIINGRIVYLTEQEIQDYRDKKEQIKKAEEEARLNAISKPEVIKVVRKEAKKIGIHPKEAISTKAGELYKKAQDAEHEVLKRQHTKKKKNTVVKDLMNSLSRRYERLRQIPSELKIQSALPAHEQAQSQTSRRKQKHVELEPETRILGLECNRTLLENVPFVNNMVIEEPEYGIFFTDEFSDQAFQRWSDIDKVGMEALVSYLVAASMVKSLENARFNMKLRKLIAEHPDQEKLKSKKVKLEALGYNVD
nr:hypothetical protein [Tanacetum cinerariifolium]